jgi:hypothetical protein
MLGDLSVDFLSVLDFFFITDPSSSSRIRFVLLGHALFPFATLTCASAVMPDQCRMKISVTRSTLYIVKLDLIGWVFNDIETYMWKYTQQKTTNSLVV